MFLFFVSDKHTYSTVTLKPCFREKKYFIKVQLMQCQLYSDGCFSSREVKRSSLIGEPISSSRRRNNCLFPLSLYLYYLLLFFSKPGRVSFTDL